MDGVPRQNEENMGPPMLELSWTLAAIAIIIVILRALIRLKGKHGLRIDDYFMVLSLVSQYQMLRSWAILIGPQGLWDNQYGSS